MKITIRQADKDTVQFIKTYGSSFKVTSKLVPHAEDAKIGYTLVDVPPYTKQYAPEKVEPETYVDNPDRVVFFAYADDQLAGQIRLWKNWNAYAYIDDIAVDEGYRGQGIGRALIECAIEWAKAGGFSGMMLETQDNNVSACRLYASCGFELRGFDTYLYKALDPSTDEIALYWYLMF
jgi:ribosomal protein S18 acetylase RimI-like enzyme